MTMTSGSFDAGAGKERGRAAARMPHFGALLKDVSAALGITSIIAALLARRRERRTRRELGALDGRMLKDIGISRGDIPRIAQKSRDARAQQAGRDGRRPSMIIHL